MLVVRLLLWVISPSNEHKRLVVLVSKVKVLKIFFLFFHFFLMFVLWLMFPGLNLSHTTRPSIVLRVIP